MSFYLLPLDITLFLLLPAIGFALWAQFRVKSTFEKHSRVLSHSGMTGAQVARKLLDDSGLYDIPVEQSSGKLTDHYDPRERVVRLSPDVYGKSSLASLGVAAHEIGHAVQHDEGYVPLAFRNNIFPLARIGSSMAFPIFFIGYLFTAPGHPSLFMDIGILLFFFAFVFQVVTLPVELNASTRAISMLQGTGILSGEEIGPARQVLNAAALTYVAALVVTLAHLLRMLLLRGRD